MPQESKESLGHFLSNVFWKYHPDLIEGTRQDRDIENFRLTYELPLNFTKITNELVVFFSSRGYRYLPQKGNNYELYFNQDNSHIFVHLACTSQETNICYKEYPFSL